MSTLIHISGYRFVTLDNLTSIQTQLRETAKQSNLLGTILLSTEGINLCVAGLPDDIDCFIQNLQAYPHFADIYFKRTSTASAPYRFLRVKCKREIVTMNVPGIKPQEKTGTPLPASTLKTWINDNKRFVLLDTRNTYEVTAGTFKNAIHLNIENFREFPQAVLTLPENYRQLPIVTFCTGGIRCEKATSFMLENGFEEVYQLKDGILEYFNECGKTHFEGDCFVFDDRITL